MKDDPHRARRAAELRRRAEERLRNQAARVDVASAAAANDRLRHELEVHQVEVELLTEALLEAEESARLARERHDEIYEFAHAGHFSLDRRGAITRLNLAAGRMLGFERKRPLARRLGSFVAEPDQIAFEAFLDAVFESQLPRSCTIHLAAPGDAARAVRIEATRTPDGAECHAVVEDLAEVAAVKEAADLDGSALRTRHEADKMDSLGALAGGIAHDFNNVLATIMANVWLAQEEIGPDHPAAESLAEIHAAGVRARDVVKQILTFSRRHPPDLQVVQLGPIVAEAVRLLRVSAPAGVEIVIVVDEGAPPVLADASQVHQIVMNLGANAVRAVMERADRRDGGGRIEVRVEPCDLALEDTRVLAGSLEPGPYARISVIDNGAGMDAATGARVFEPFFTTRTVGEGTGLGLSVVHGVAATHKGAVTFQTKEGHGTAFQVYFPQATAALTSETPNEGSPVLRSSLISSRMPHVVYVDDEASQVRAMTLLLERDGYKATGHADPRAALEAIRANPDDVDLVLTDFNMPGLSGLHVAREVARIRADLPVVLVSGNITDGIRSEATRAGVRQVIHKASVDEVRAALRRLLKAGDAMDVG